MSKVIKSQTIIMNKWKTFEKTLVSICCITYNHEKFIRDALDGFLMQQTDFSFEVLINDDASTDKTADIIREYEAEYPGIIKPIYQIENRYSQGIKPMFKYNIPRAEGRYIALCEGDDYWTDPLKLQKQVNFLEKNDDYVICCHGAEKIKNDIKNGYWFKPPEEKDYYMLEDYIAYGRSFMPTASLVVRNYKDKFHEWIYNSPAGDMAFIMSTCLQNNGKIKRFNECMSVHREHDGGVYSSKNYLDQQVFSIETRIYLRQMLPAKYEKYFKMGIQNVLQQIIANRDNLLKKNNELKVSLKHKDELIKHKDELIKHVYNSYTYKLGNFFLFPVKKLKSKLG